MKICFSVGPNSKGVCNTLKKTADNLDFYYYSSIQELVKESNIRHLYFDRIVFTPKILGDIESDFRVLNDYIRMSSDSTEIVYLLNSNHSEGLEAFNSIFNSPLYTPVIVDNLNSKSAMELVTLDIVELKAKYYDLDVSKVDAVATSATKSKPDKGKKQEKTPKRKGGFIGNLFGGSKNQPKTEEVVIPESEPVETVSNAGELESENPSGFGTGPQSVIASNGGEMELNEDSDLNKSENIFDSSASSDTFPEPPDLGIANSSEDDDLSIGDFGSSHSDTGFLDGEDEDAELQQFLAEQENEEQEQPKSTERYFTNDSLDQSDLDNIINAGVRSFDIRKPERAPLTGTKHDLLPDYDKSFPNIDLIIGTDAKKITESIIDEAMKLVQEEGIKVLIVDVDTKYNCILSYIDTNKFYFEGAVDGISKQRVYEEDNIGVCSNGYGSGVSPKDLLRLFSSRALKDYDMVFVCCPVDSLDSFSLEVIRRCHILVMSGNDRSEMFATSIGLTNRDVVDINVERYIMGNCEVEFFDDAKQEDIDFVKRVCLFANGSWLNKC